jgi:hypothetical protein
VKRAQRSGAARPPAPAPPIGAAGVRAGGVVSRRSLLGAALLGVVTVGPLGRLAATAVATVRVRPAFRAASPPAAMAGKPYRYRFVATEDPRYMLASGHLPAPFHLDAATGVISGTPRSAGTETFRIRAANAAGSVTTRPLEIRTYPRGTKKPRNTQRPVISDRSPSVGQTIRVTHGLWT